MERQGAVTFMGNPMTLIGGEVKAGQAAPDFKIHAFEDGMVAITAADLKGKPTLLNVVPSLDTGVCQIQDQTIQRKTGGVRRQSSSFHDQHGLAVCTKPILRRREH